MKTGCYADEAIENIDIVTLHVKRASLKNFKYVAVVIDPSDCTTVLEEIRNRRSYKTRIKLAKRLDTSKYDMNDYRLSVVRRIPAVASNYNICNSNNSRNDYNITNNNNNSKNGYSRNNGYNRNNICNSTIANYNINNNSNSNNTQAEMEQQKQRLQQLQQL